MYRVHRNSLGLDIPSGVYLSDAEDDYDDEQSTAERVHSESDICPAYCFGDHSTPTDIQYDV